MYEQVEMLYAKLSKSEKPLFVIAVFCIFVFLVDLLVLGPILSHISKLDAEIITKAASIRRDLRILSFQDAILKEYVQYMKYLDTGEKSQEEIIAALLRKIETIAAQKSVSVSNIQPGDVAESIVYKEYKTSLQGEGTLTNVLSFMYALEESDYLFQISKYTLMPKSKGADVMKFTMDISRVLVSAEDIKADDFPQIAAETTAKSETATSTSTVQEEKSKAQVLPEANSGEARKNKPAASTSHAAAATTAPLPDEKAVHVNRQEPFTEENPMTVAPSSEEGGKS